MHRCRCRHYCVLAALASACTAACEVMFEFMNLAITSETAPCTAELTAIPCARLGSSVPALLAASISSIDLIAQLSDLARDTPERAGIDPLARLKVSWNSGLMMALASVSCAFCTSGFL